MPVMEGKAALFKRFAGVDAWPVCLDTEDTEEIISIVKAIAPVYGGVNLEDIAAPRCFEIERLSGDGAAGHAIIRLLHAQGAGHIVACDRSGAIHRGETYGDDHRQWIADNTNQDSFAGSLHDALLGADIFIGVSAPNLLTAEHVASIAPGAVVLALAKPDPEIHPTEAAKHAVVVATGRSDFPDRQLRQRR